MERWTQSPKLPQLGIDWPIMWSSIYKNVAVAANFMETFISLSPTPDRPSFSLSFPSSPFLCGALIGY